MNSNEGLNLLSRRELLKRGLAVSASMMVGGGFLASSSASWALEVKSLSPQTMTTLIQMARDIYPHDRFGDELYATAVKGYDEKASSDPATKTLVESGVELLDKLAKESGHDNYISVGWEADRVAILKQIESEPFFQTIRGGLVVSLYNQKAVWKILGYEGASYEQGGYINRGFDDINWL